MASINKVGIVGSGTMGTGLMINTIVSGLDVTLIDRDPAVLNNAKVKLKSYLERQVSKERMTENDAIDFQTHITLSTDVRNLRDCDLVIEAVFEKLELKQQVFKDIEEVVSESVILATNTSCLRLVDVSAELKNKDRFCGLHYFSPAEINPVVEFIRGDQTSVATANKVVDFLKQTKRTIIECNDNYGFALNRFFCPYTNEAVRCLDEQVATTGEIDMVAQERLGLAFGPFAVMNIIKPAVNLNAVKHLSPHGPFYQVAHGLDDLGTQNGMWEIDTPTQLPEKADEIEERLLGAMFIPIFETVSENTATLDAIDLGAQEAFRFSPGIIQRLKTIGADKMDEILSSLSTKYGHEKPGNVQSVYEVIA